MRALGKVLSDMLRVVDQKSLYDQAVRNLVDATKRLEEIGDDHAREEERVKANGKPVKPVSRPDVPIDRPGK